MEKFRKPNYEHIYGLKEEEVERVFKEQGIEGFEERQRERIKEVLNYEPKHFDKKLYNTLTLYEKTCVNALESNSNRVLDKTREAIRCSLSGETFKPFKNLEDDAQPTGDELEFFTSGRYYNRKITYILQYEYYLKQKYNEEGDK